jgi:hypothetical protein
LWVPKNRFTPQSGVLVDKSAELVAARDLAGGSWTGRVGRFGRQERESAVWTLAVVMGGVGAEHVLEVAAAEDQRLV